MSSTDGGVDPSSEPPAAPHAHFPPAADDDEGGGAMSDSERSLTKRMDRRTWTGPPLLDRIHPGRSLTEPDSLIVSPTPRLTRTHVHTPSTPGSCQPPSLTEPDSLIVRRIFISSRPTNRNDGDGKLMSIHFLRQLRPMRALCLTCFDCARLTHAFFPSLRCRR